MMMKWGRKKGQDSFSRPSLINHVFSTSWLKKLKLKSGSSQPGKVKTEQSLPANRDEGRFYGGVDDLYWRLSFGHDSLEVEEGIGGVRSLWIDSDDENEVPLSRSCSEESRRFKDMLSEMRKTRRVMEYEQEKDNLKRKKAKAMILKAQKGKALKDQEVRALCRTRSFKTEEVGLQSAERDAFEAIPGRIIQSRQRSPSYTFRTIGEDCVFESVELQEYDTFSKDEFSSLRSGDTNIREIRLKHEPHRKSVYKSRGKQGKQRRVKTRAKAPRAAAKNECKIKVLEDIKKTKKRKKRNKMMEREGECKGAFDSYAIVKNSFDPQQDFRDSMVEMIIEKGIKQPAELEDLLVCYLMLNGGEYHDLIIEVFRQVWFDLNHLYFGPKFQIACSCHH